MDFSKNIKAFLNTLPIKDMRASEKFLAVAAYCAGGSTAKPSTLKDVKKLWSRGILDIVYHPGYYQEAQRESWVNPEAQGTFSLTEAGLQHLDDIGGSASSPTAPAAMGLYIFRPANPHSFGKLLRSIFSSATKKVLIADSYVDETIFDTVLDSIDKSLEIKLIYGKQVNSFLARSSPFGRQYIKFTTKRFSKLHDRFFIVDGTGYVIGPSIKDAAVRSPALVIKLNRKDSAELEKFFLQLWALST